MLSARDISDHLNATRGSQIRESLTGAKTNSSFDPSKYGLKASDKAEDHEAGIVGDGRGNTYEIIGHSGKFGQEGLDKFGGDVYSSSLEKDSGIDHSNFNTPSDVAAALKNLEISDTSQPEEDPRPEYIKKSETLAKAEAGVQAYDETYLTGGLGDAIFGPDSDKTNDKFLEKYKLALAENLKPVRADGSDRESIIQQEKEAVEGSGSDVIA